MLLPIVFSFAGLQNVGADHAEKDYETGWNHYYGVGVEKDFAVAFKWFKKAADQGESNGPIFLDT